MLSSHEIKHNTSKGLGVEVPRSISACRQSVRHKDAGGVQEQGEAAMGLAWNTGYPSDRRDKAGHRSPPAYQRPSNAQRLVAVCCAKKSNQPSLYPLQGLQAEQVAEVSGSLSSAIVAIEKWGTSDGADPPSSQGLRPKRYNPCHEPRAASLR